MAVISIKNKTKSGSLLAGNSAYEIPTAFESIATTTVGSGGATSITFSSIPQTYTHLQLRTFTGNAANSNGSGFFSFNGDTTGTNYYDHILYGTGSAISGTADANGSYLPYWLGDTNKMAVYIADILDYTNTNKYKTIKSLGGYDANGSGNIGFVSTLWKSTSAVSSITITTNQSFIQYSSFALYGIKGA